MRSAGVFLLTIATLALVAGAGAARADDLFTRPDQCVRKVTVQLSDCHVQTAFTCGEGTARLVRIETFRDGALSDVELDDPEGNPIAVGSPDGSFQIRLQRKIDPVSLSRTLSSGSDTLDLRITARLAADLAGDATMTGTTSLTGKSITVGGASYPEVRLKYRIQVKGAGEFAVDSLQLYDAASGAILSSGQATVLRDGKEIGQHDDRVMEVLHAGDRGFASETPRYGCGSLTWNLSAVPRTAS